jgi:hypothetical protein
VLAGEWTRERVEAEFDTQDGPAIGHASLGLRRVGGCLLGGFLLRQFTETRHHFLRVLTGGPMVRFNLYRGCAGSFLR